MNRLRRASSSAIVGGLGAAVLTQAFVLVTGVLAARLLGPNDRGYLALIWTCTLVTAQLGTLGLPLAITYEIAAKRATVSSLLRDLGPAARRQIAIVSVLHAVIVLLLVEATDTPSDAAWISVIVVPCSLVQLFGLAVLQGMHRFRAYNALRLVAVATYAAGLSAAAIVGNPGLTTVTAVWVFGFTVAAAATAGAVWRTARHDREPPPITSASPAAMRQFGLRGLLGWASPTETLRIDQLAVGLVLSAYDLGLYVAALAFTNLPRFFAQAVGSVAYPRVAAISDPTTQRRSVWRYVALGALLSIAVALPLALLAGPVLTVAFGAAFEDAASPMRVLLAGTVVLCARRVLSDAMRGAGFPAAGSWAEAASWVTLVPALPVLGLTYGLDGVATAIGLSYVVSLGALAWASRRLNGPSPALTGVPAP